MYKDSIRDIRILLNLIEKLQKENEELNRKILSDVKIYQLAFEDGEESYIRKVKDKIEILEKLQNEFSNNEELRIKIIAYKELIKEMEDK